MSSITSSIYESINTDPILKWKHEKEVKILKTKIVDIEKKMRERRLHVAGQIVIPVQIRGVPGVDKKRVYEAAFAADSELQCLIDNEKQLKEKIEAWNVLLKVGIKKLPMSLYAQLREEYADYETTLISESLSKIFVYDKEKNRFIIS